MQYTYLIHQKNSIGTKRMEETTGPLFIISEEHNNSVKFEDNHLPDDHVNLLNILQIKFETTQFPIISRRALFKETTPDNEEGRQINLGFNRRHKIEDQWAFMEAIGRIMKKTST